MEEPNEFILPLLEVNECEMIDELCNEDNNIEDDLSKDDKHQGKSGWMMTLIQIILSEATNVLFSWLLKEEIKDTTL